MKNAKLLPFLLVHSFRGKNEILSFNLFNPGGGGGGGSASGIQLLIDFKTNKGKFEKKFARESARLFVSNPIQKKINEFTFGEKNQNVDADLF